MPAQARVGCVQRHHVALSELDTRSQASRSLHHRWRQVNATNLNAVLVQVTSNMSRAATHVARRADLTHACRKSVEQLSVEWLVLQLIEDAPDVFVRYLVVAGLVVVAFVSVHVERRVMRPITIRRTFVINAPA